MSKLSQGVIFVFLLVATLLTSPFYVYASTEVFDDVTVDTTWTVAESPYVINFPTTVYPGATLSIDPGVVVKFEGVGSLVVEGALQAAGTTSKKIHFTSIKDDSVGGDTNADGASTLPSASDWQGILFMNTSSPSTVANAEVRFASVGIENHGSDISVSDTVLSNLNSGIISFASEDILTNVSFSNIGQSGLLLFDNSEANVNNLSLADLGEFADGINLFSKSVIRLDNSTLSGSLDSSGISVYEGSDVYIDGSIISGFNTAFADYGSGSFGLDSISIKNSQIKNNKVGIQLFANDSILSVSKNTIHDNTINGVESYAEFTANLKNNFWGDASGPYNEFSNPEGLGNGIFYIPDYNNILFKPWLASWPSEPAPCCSSVIFVPGFEGSRLYERRGNGGLTQRWDPRSPSDISNLFLNNNGTSNSNIYTRDIIESAPVVGNIYRTIQSKLDIFKNSFQNIDNWSAHAYDWRFSVNDLIQNGAKYESGIKKLEDEISILASTSKTQKVTLVGHSNGGLMIKKIISELKKKNKENLVDKIILVDSPQLGTPSALTAMLHGYGTKLGYGLVLREGRAREWLLNMPGIYGLLPSAKLLSKTSSSVIELDSSVNPITNWVDRYGDSIDYLEMKNLATGGDGRSQPNRLNLNTPYVLKPNFFNSSEQLHNEIDNLGIPESIEVHEIAGWGLSTISGVRYNRAPQLLYLSNNINQLRTKAKFTYRGDGEVILDSQIDYGFNKYYIDLLGYNNDNDTDFDHTNIMENPEVLDVIENILTDSIKPTPHISNDLIVLDEDTPKYKIISMHSPANIDVYDSQGRHVGLDVDESDSDFVQINTEIPNSNFFLIGEEKYAVVPDNGDDYEVKVSGTGSGLFTLEIETQQGNDIVDKVEYANLAVTKDLKADLVIYNDGSESTLNLDHNGDGVVDEEVLPNTDTNPVSYLNILRNTILDLELPKKKEKQMLFLVDNIYKLIQKGKVEKATKKMQNFLQRIQLGKGSIKNLTQQERDDLASKINNFLNSF